MKWVGISGTWQLTSPEVEADVRNAVRALLNDGNGIITGGALGVDLFAMNEVIQCNLEKERVKICLPVPFDLYKNHYRKRAFEGVITHGQAEGLISTLKRIYASNDTAIIEDTRFTACDKESYYARNGTIVDLSDELYAFQVNNSSGTGDTIEKARSQNKKVTLFTYTL
jgi:predicted Rossmann fold nucleotide-binding protein DprA/Smf involved in DNA uptake